MQLRRSIDRGPKASAIGGHRSRLQRALQDSVFCTTKPEHGRATLMPVQFPSESGLPAEASHGRSNGRTPGSVRLGFPLRDANTGVSQDITGLAAAV